LVELEGSDLGPSAEFAIDSSSGAGVVARVLIDTSTDLRQQALRYGIKRIDSVLFTHTHADHIYGFDDLRSFNFTTGIVIPIYASLESQAELRRIFKYVFDPDPEYSGGPVPQVVMHDLKPYQTLNLHGVSVLPLAIKHGKDDILGFRIGDFAYLTDCSFISEETRRQLVGLKVLILNGLRFRPHPTHFTIEQAVREIEAIKPEQAYLTHLSHEVDYGAGMQRISELTEARVALAHDGLTIQL